MKDDLEKLIERMINSGILFEEARQEFEKQFINKILDRYHHNLSKAAVALGIHRNTLSKRLEQYQNGNNYVAATPSRSPKKRKPISKRVTIKN